MERDIDRARSVNLHRDSVCSNHNLFAYLCGYRSFRTLFCLASSFFDSFKRMSGPYLNGALIEKLNNDLKRTNLVIINVNMPFL